MKMMTQKTRGLPHLRFAAAASKKRRSKLILIRSPKNECRKFTKTQISKMMILSSNNLDTPRGTSMIQTHKKNCLEVMKKILGKEMITPMLILTT